MSGDIQQRVKNERRILIARILTCNGTKFMIHGNKAIGNTSQDWIILSPQAIRERIAFNGDNILEEIR